MYDFCIFSELPVVDLNEAFIYHIGDRLGFSMALYEYDGAYIRTLDFTKCGKVNFEHISSVMGDNEDYADNFT